MVAQLGSVRSGLEGAGKGQVVATHVHVQNSGGEFLLLLQPTSYHH